MGFLYSTKQATIKHWNAALVIGTTTYALTDLPSRTLGTNQARGTCSCKTNVFPDYPSGTAAHIDITLNGETDRFFTGKMDVRPITDNPPTYEVTLIDDQALLEKVLTTSLTWSNVAWVDGVRDLLHKAGVTDSQIASIYNPGSTYKIAPNYAIVVDVAAASIASSSTTTIKNLLDELMTFAGAQLLVAADGQVHVVENPGWPDDTVGTVYAYGASPSAFEYGFMNSKRTIGSIENVVASFRAYGPRRPDKTLPNATFTLSGVTGKADSQQYRLIQTQACADAIAAREIVVRNRQSTLVEVSAPLNPDLRPSDSIKFRNPILGWTTNAPALVVSISSSAETMTMQLSVGAHPGTGTTTHIPPPTASFTMMYEQQPISLNGIIAPYYVVEAQATASDPSGFGITGISWAATCAGTVDPTSVSVDMTKPAVNPVFVFSTTEGATISLTVESASGAGAISTQAVSPPTSELFSRVLSVACESGWKILAGATGWRTFAGNCTAVPGVNDVGPLLAGFSDGKLYTTEDYLLTTPTLLHTFSDGVRCIFVNPSNGQEVIAGIGTGFYHSTDGGMTWLAGHAFDNDINYCESSGANPNEIRVCAGPNVFISYDGGSTFSVLLTGPTGTTCRKIASAPWGHLAVWSGTSAIADAAQFEEGGALDWSEVAPEYLPVDIASVTPMQYEEGFVIAAGAGNDLVRDGLYGQLTYLSAGSGTTFLYSVGADKKVTYLTQTARGGPHKLVLHNKAFLIDDIDTVYHIGYGQATNPGLPSEFVLLPWSASGDLDKAWHYVPTLGYTALNLPEVSGAWMGMDICPTKPNEWLIWTNNHIYWSGDAGVSWTQIFTPPEESFSIRGHTIGGACFTGKGRQWFFTLASSDGFGHTGSSIVVGELANHTGRRVAGWAFPKWPTTTTDLMQLMLIPTRGYDGEVWALAGAEGIDPVHVSYDYVVWIEPSSLAVHQIGATPYNPGPLLANSGRAALAVWSNNIGYTANYATTTPTAVIAAGGVVVICDVSPTVQRIFVGGRVGVGEIMNLLTSPTVSVVAGGSTNISEIVGGSRRRGCVALGRDVVDGHLLVFTFNGAQWVTVNGPTGLTAIGAIGVPEP